MQLIPYLLVKNRLKQINDIGLVDYDFGQGTNASKGQLTNVPAALISISNANPNPLGGNYQMAVLQIEVRLITDCTHANDEALTIGNELQHQALFEAINAKLQKWRGILGQLPDFANYGEATEVVTGSLQRTFIGFPKINKKYLSSTQRFQCVVISNGASVGYKVRPLLPILLVTPYIQVNEVTDQLSATNGQWFSKSPIAYTYQWFKEGEIIPGETNQNIAFTEADNNQTFYCQITAINEVGNTIVNTIAHTVKVAIVDTTPNIIYENGIYEGGIYTNEEEPPTGNPPSIIYEANIYENGIYQ